MNNNVMMKRVSMPGMFLALIIFVSPAVLAADSEWEYSADVYLWGSQLGVTTPGGRGSTLPFYKIIDNLKMAFMGGMQAQKDKWSLSADLIYLSLDKNVNRDAGYIDAVTDVDGNVSLKSWIVTPAVGYAIHESESSRVEIVGGVRYLWLKSGANVEFDTVPVFDEAVSKSYWDAIIGVRARFDLNDKWFMPLYADIGTGDTDITWQGFAGVGYKFDKVKAVFGYRYLRYEFDSDNRVMGEMTVNGPLLGLVMDF